MFYTMMRRVVLAALFLSVTAAALGASPKRLVLCLDGTWNNPYDEQQRIDPKDTDQTPIDPTLPIDVIGLIKPSNPLKMCRAVMPFDQKDGQLQIAYYATGVGSFAVYPGPSNKLLHVSDRALGGAFGAGFERNVEDALSFLVLNYEPGDQVFIFGFSRGAATARAVAQFLDWNGGVPEKNDAYYLPKLFRAYVGSKGKPGIAKKAFQAINDSRAKEHRAPIAAMRSVTVKYLGVWDTVMALGSRFKSTGASTSTADRSFYAGTMPSACVIHARQALAVDEHRFDFRPEIWIGKHDGQRMEQRWFAGVHSNVGGGYRFDGLANIAFKWILEGAEEEGLKVDPEFVGHYEGKEFHTMYDSSSVLYKTLDLLRGRTGRGKRSLLDLPEAANADIDATVIGRMRLSPGEIYLPDGTASKEPYRPQNVIAYLAAHPEIDASVGPLPDDVKKQICAIRHCQAQSAKGAP